MDDLIFMLIWIFISYIYIDKTFIKTLRYEYESLKYESPQMCAYEDYFTWNRG